MKLSYQNQNKQIEHYKLAKDNEKNKKQRIIPILAV